MIRYVGCMTFGGGFDLGATQAGLTLTHRLELPGGFGLPACEANRQVLGQFEAQVTTWQDWDTGETDVVLANPPCSGFSLMSTQAFRGVDSPVNHCMHAHAEFVGRTRPYVAVMESVQQAYTGGRSLMQQLRARAEEVSGLEYGLWHVLHNAAVFGNAAIRRRYFMVMSRVPFGVDWDPSTPRTTLRDVIGDLERVPVAPDGLGQPDGHVVVTGTWPARLHALMTSIDWPEGWGINQALTRHVVRHGYRGLPYPWDNDDDGKWTKAADNCNVSRDGLRTLGVHGFNAPGRWIYDGHARVVTGATPVTGLHPVLPRAFTLREIARIMGYPDDFTLRAHVENRAGPSWLGKGVCVESGRWIADWTRRSVEGNPGSITGNEIGEREWLVQVDKVRHHRASGLPLPYDVRDEFHPALEEETEDA